MKRILLVLAALIGACAPSNALFLRGGGTVSSGVGEAADPSPSASRKRPGQHDCADDHRHGDGGREAHGHKRRSGLAR